MKVPGKVFIVTGAGGGIGSALVKQLLQKGAKVLATDRDKTLLAELKKECGQLGQLETQVADISTETTADMLLNTAVKKLSSVDGIIHCAGIIQPFKEASSLPLADANRVMNINFFGTLFLIRSLVPYLKNRPEAHIVNVSSMGGFLPVPGQGVYGASKAAVKLLSESLYAELINSSVKVSIVFPGATNTNITKNSGVKTSVAANEKSSPVPMLSAEKAASQIIKGVEKNKLYIYTGADSKTMNILYRFFPKFATRFIAKQMKDILAS